MANMMTSFSDACDENDDDDSLVGDFSIDLGASCTTPRKSTHSVSSISFDVSYGSVLEDNKNNKSSSSNLCYSRWESLGESNSNMMFGHADTRGEGVSGSSNNNNSKLPSLIFISKQNATAAATMQQRAEMAIKMPQRQQTSHVRKQPPLERISSSGTLSFGESPQKSIDEKHEQRQQLVALMAKLKQELSRRCLLTRTAAFSYEKSGHGLGSNDKSSHTFAAYSLMGPSNHTFAVYSKHGGPPYSNHSPPFGQTSSSHTPPFGLASSHTFASFASVSNHHHRPTGAASVLSTWESVEEIGLEAVDDSSIASFSSDTATSRASSNQGNIILNGTTPTCGIPSVM
jgi:hypothetical protein